MAQVLHIRGCGFIESEVMMVTKKLVDQARMYSNLTRLNMLASATGADNKGFQKVLNTALDRIETEIRLETRPPILTQDLAAMEARKHQPVTEEPTGGPQFRKILDVVLANEGSAYVRKDGGRESSKYGVLQATANRYGYAGDVKNLSKAEAEAIYQKIWGESGAEKLPYPLSLVHFDTYVNSPAAAGKLLKASGGDIDTYLKGRGQRYSRLAQLKPKRYGKYLAGWMSRIRNLKQAIAEYQTGQALAQGSIKAAYRG
jgi:hypothetical protein